jgi:hypothetical protein
MLLLGLIVMVVGTHMLPRRMFDLCPFVRLVLAGSAGRLPKKTHRYVPIGNGQDLKTKKIWSSMIQDSYACFPG